MVLSNKVFIIKHQKLDVYDIIRAITWSMEISIVKMLTINLFVLDQTFFINVLHYNMSKQRSLYFMSVDIGSLLLLR